MTRTEEVPHLRSLFRQSKNNIAATMSLIDRIRAVALEYLPASVIAKVPPPYFSDHARKAYEAKGYNLEWNLEIGGETGATAFCWAAREANISQSELSATSLLKACNEAREAGSVSVRDENCILDCYAGLDLDAIHGHKKSKQERSKGGSHSRYSQFSAQIDTILDEYIEGTGNWSQDAFIAQVKVISGKEPSKGTVRDWKRNRKAGRPFWEKGESK